MAYTYSDASQQYGGVGSSYNGDPTAALVIDVSTSITIQEQPSVCPNVLNVSVFDEPRIVLVAVCGLSALYMTAYHDVYIFEVVGVSDFPLFVGPIADNIYISEATTTYPDLQFLSVTESIIIVTEATTQFLNVLHAFAYDDVQYGEPIDLYPTALVPSVYDQITVDDGVFPATNCAYNFPMNEGVGTVALDQVSGIVGTITSAVWTTDRYGRSDRALYFNGSSRVDTGTLATKTYSQMTVSLWVKTSQVPASYTIMAQYEGWNPGFIFAFTASGSLRTYLWDTHEDSSDSSGVVNNDVWHHVVFTWAASTGWLNFYIDGQARGGKQTTITGNIVTGGSKKLRIGNGVIGSIDDVVIFDRALTLKEINQLYFNTADMTLSALYANAIDTLTPISENVGLSVTALYMDVSESIIIITEYTAQFLNALNLSVYDTLNAITEQATILLLTLNVDRFTSISIISENVTIFLNTLYISRDTSVTIFEVVGLSDFPLYVGPIYDSIYITAEVVSVYLTTLNINVNDSIQIQTFVYGVETRSRLPADCQSCGWTDGTYYWRAWFNAPSSRIQVEWTTNPDGAWTENVNARITDAGVGNDFSIHGNATDVAIVYSAAGSVYYRRENTYSTTFTWQAAITLFTSGTPSGATYSRPVAVYTATPHWMVTATQLNAGTQTLQSRVSDRARPNNAGHFNAAVSVNAGTASQVYSALGSLNTTDNCVVLYSEGTALNLKRYNGTIWDASPTSVATMKASLLSGTPTQFECWGDTVNNKVHCEYIKSTGTTIERDYTTAGGLTAESTLDASTDTEHVSVGAFSNTDTIYSWSRPLIEFDGSQKYYVTEKLATGVKSAIIQIGNVTSKRIVASDVAKSDTATLSAFVMWEENDGVYSQTLGVAFTMVENIYITEVITNIRLSALYVSAGDDIYITTNVTASPNPLYASAITSIYIAEVVSISPNPLITGTVFDSIYIIAENVTIQLTALVPNVFDTILPITENVTILLTVLVPDRFTSIHIDEQVTILLATLVPSVSDDIYISEAETTFLPELVLAASTSIYIQESTSQLLDALFLDAFSWITIFDIAPLNPNEMFVIAIDSIYIQEVLEEYETQLYISVLESITTITEVETTLLPILVPERFTSIYIQEVVSMSLSAIFLVITDGWTIYEFAQAWPDVLVPTVGSDIYITQFVSMSLNALGDVDVHEDVQIYEVVSALDFPLYAAPVPDTISITAEVVTLNLNVLQTSVASTIAVVSELFTSDLQCNIFVIEQSQYAYSSGAVAYSNPSVSYTGHVASGIVIGEFTQLSMVLIVSVGDSITIEESLGELVDVLYMSAYTDIHIDEDETTLLTDLKLSVFDTILPITEDVITGVLVRIDASQGITIEENVAFRLDQLYMNAHENVFVDDYAQFGIGTIIITEDSVIIEEVVNLNIPTYFSVFEDHYVTEDVTLDAAIQLLADDLLYILEFFDYNQIFEMSGFDDIYITEDFNYIYVFDLFASDDVTIYEDTTEDMPEEGIVFDDIWIIEDVAAYITEQIIPLRIDNIAIDDTFVRGQLIIVKGMRRMRLESKIPNPKFKTQSKIEYFTHVQEVGV